MESIQQKTFILILLFRKMMIKITLIVKVHLFKNQLIHQRRKLWVNRMSLLLINLTFQLEVESYTQPQNLVYLDVTDKTTVPSTSLVPIKHQ